MGLERSRIWKGGFKIICKEKNHEVYLAKSEIKAAVTEKALLSLILFTATLKTLVIKLVHKLPQFVSTRKFRVNWSIKKKQWIVEKKFSQFCSTHLWPSNGNQILMKEIDWDTQKKVFFSESDKNYNLQLNFLNLQRDLHKYVRKEE